MEEHIFRVTLDAPGFAPVPLRLLQDERIKDPSTVAVYVALASFIDYGTARCFPSLRTIGERARCSSDAAARHIALLVSLGYAEKTSGKETGKPNTYHLVDPWGRREGTVPARQGCRMDAVGGVAPVPDKQDSMNETQEQREARTPQPTGPASEPSVSLSPIIARIKAEAQAIGAPPSFIGKAWSAGILELQRSGVVDSELLEAFRACIEQAPDRVTFFPRDFLRWRKVSRERMRRQPESRSVSGNVQRERDAERARILEEQESEQGRELVAQAVARLPWRQREIEK